LREEHRLTVFSNRILGTKMEEVTGDWKFVLFTKYYWGEKIKENKMGGAFGT
jgi:hypothetical protein